MKLSDIHDEVLETIFLNGDLKFLNFVLLA